MICRPSPSDARAVLGAARLHERRYAAGLDRPCARRSRQWAGRDEGTAPQARTKELDDEALTKEEPAEVCERNGGMEVGLPGVCEHW
jgi:hypothetical protein